jgi:mRNA-degrading endonuclease RelE of RelBE toxin-antitoxin system
MRNRAAARAPSPLSGENWHLRLYANGVYNYLRRGRTPVVIIETPTFTRLIKDLLDDDNYRILQIELAENPGKGAIIRGTGGIRKLRWFGSGRGKRGGSRVIYYWARDQDVVLLLLAYSKNENDDLTPAQRRVLRQLVEEEFG